MPWTLILTAAMKILDMALDKSAADTAKKKAYVDFLMLMAPNLASSSRCYQAYKGMDAALDAQIAAIKAKP